MNYIMQITDRIREVHGNIAAFHFVIYSLDPRQNLKKFCWIKVEDLPEKLDWLREKKVEFAKRYNVRQDELSVGLANTVLLNTERDHHFERRFIPMIDFDALFGVDEIVPDQILLTLELLGIGPGVISRSSQMNFGFQGYHFYGQDLWDREKWKQFVTDGLFDEYGFDEELNLPMYPKMPYFSAKIIGESWCKLIAKQKGIAFLRVGEKYWNDPGPEILDLFSGGPNLLELPPEDAPCMPVYREAENKWLDSVDTYTREYHLYGSPRFVHNDAPRCEKFCVEGCAINGCSTKCPATRSRFPEIFKERG